MIFSSADILSSAQLKRLKEHKYSASGSSFLDPFMQPFWNWLVKKFPLWLAPNLMTIAGLVINIFTSLILVFYSPDARHEAPRWAFLICAVGLFVYQTLDACDGKQARRTGTSSPLGELFDHGCDSMSTVFVSLGVCIAVQLGAYPAWMFFQCFAAFALFYCAHWQTYVSGTLRFGKFDVTEAQFTVMFIHLISAVFGPSIWTTRIPWVNLEMKLLPVLCGIFAASIAVYSYFTVIFTGGIGRNGSTVALPFLHVELRLLPVIIALSVSAVMCYSNFVIILSGGVGKNGSTVAGTSVLSPFIPMGFVVIPAFIIYQKSTTGIYEHHPCLYILAFGMVAAKVTNRLVIAHMSKSEMDYFDSVLVGPGMLFLNQYFNTFFREYIVLWLCLVYSTSDLLHYCTIVCSQICNHMNIQMFRITPNLNSSPARSIVSPTQKEEAESHPLIANEQVPPHEQPFSDSPTYTEDRPSTPTDTPTQSMTTL
ncbi:LOW QUALITY PROTEIN: cholinephosphotransferase 1-like [Tachypleus tridentatus]|uniref:LOW QUALITY PROTEIN: cholinephosphotransferase 1-like n=1 Tax=Tachypleus tridentatus TaxID=6853 RepID=UPI003FD5F826